MRTLKQYLCDILTWQFGYHESVHIQTNLPFPKNGISMLVCIEKHRDTLHEPQE